VAGSNGFDRVNSAISFNLSDGVHFLGAIEMGVLMGSANLNITGNALNNLLIGNSGNNVINGAGGNDVLRGMAGNDIYWVDSTSDLVDESIVGSNGFDRINSAVSVDLLNGGRARGEIEMAVLLGSADLNVGGNDLNNLLYGNSGNNVVNGWGGNDVMHGGDGNDLLQGMEGNDTLDGGAGADQMIGGDGADTYWVDSAGDVVDESVAGSTGFDRINSALTINLWDVNHVRGTVEMAVLTGAANVNASGNAVNNLIVGNAANNVLNGGFGNDILRGLGGSDTFFFSTALNAVHNVDRIDDFNVAADTIRLENSVFTGLSAGVLAANAFHIGAAAADTFDRIVYNSTTGALSFDADGTGGAAALRFATLDTGLGLTNADFVVT
jgi:Ca2+-binding RTX toxin-like protein